MSRNKMKNSSITLKKNKSLANKMNKMSTYVLDTDYENNTNTIIKYYEEFSYEKIDELLEEAYTNISYAHENNLDTFKNDADFLAYVMWLISVRFTSLSKEVPSNLEEQAVFMKEMKETGLFQRIHDEVLNQEEVYKVLDKINEMNQLVHKVSELGEEELEKLKGSIENPEIFNLGKKAPIHPLVNPKGNK